MNVTIELEIIGTSINSRELKVNEKNLNYCF